MADDSNYQRTRSSNRTKSGRWGFEGDPIPMPQAGPPVPIQRPDSVIRIRPPQYTDPGMGVGGLFSGRMPEAELYRFMSRQNPDAPMLDYNRLAVPGIGRVGSGMHVYAPPGIVTDPMTAPNLDLMTLFSKLRGL